MNESRCARAVGTSAAKVVLTWWPLLLAGVFLGGACHSGVKVTRQPTPLLEPLDDNMNQDRPGGALRLFAAALQAGDCLQVLALAPPEVRRRLGDEALERGCRRHLQRWRDLAAAIRAAAPGLRVSGERAELELADRRCLKLLRVEGRWYVEDLLAGCPKGDRQ
ncbi:MAG: hypothetical protein DRI34_02215 [Deltaproteobacteria bacterium]|nr:MAG: hypothetical protein DRI34_02215 [Deltaproteobacteria bacterium]